MVVNKRDFKRRDERGRGLNGEESFARLPRLSFAVGQGAMRGSYDSLVQLPLAPIHWLTFTLDLAVRSKCDGY